MRTLPEEGWTDGEIEGTVRSLAEEKGKAARPRTVPALRHHGPHRERRLFETLTLLGRERTLRRLERVAEKLKKPVG